jgi:hypothetical protein
MTKGGRPAIVCKDYVRKLCHLFEQRIGRFGGADFEVTFQAKKKHANFCDISLSNLSQISLSLTSGK